MVVVIVVLILVEQIAFRNIPHINTIRRMLTGTILFRSRHIKKVVIILRNKSISFVFTETMRGMFSSLGKAQVLHRIINKYFRNRIFILIILRKTNNTLQNISTYTNFFFFSFSLNYIKSFQRRIIYEEVLGYSHWLVRHLVKLNNQLPTCNWLFNIRF